jgi:hypothetical protein
MYISLLEFSRTRMRKMCLFLVWPNVGVTTLRREWNSSSRDSYIPLRAEFLRRVHFVAAASTGTCWAPQPTVFDISNSISIRNSFRLNSRGKGA